jgi:assimilatory nitrate reductase catalytic subunit
MVSGPGVRISLRLAGDVVAAARFETLLLPSARGPADALCAALVGTTTADAAQWSALDVSRVGGLPAGSPVARTIHFAKSAALQALLGRRGLRADLVCTCFHVNEREIVDAIRLHGASSLDQLRARLPATTGCGSCRPEVQRLLDLHGSRTGR